MGVLLILIQYISIPSPIQYPTIQIVNQSSYILATYIEQWKLFALVHNIGKIHQHGITSERKAPARENGMESRTLTLALQEPKNI